MALFHSDKGSVNYTIVGTPTIVDGVVSGFVNNDSYLTIGTVIPFATANSWELKFAFRLSSLSEMSQIFDASTTNKGVQIYYLNSNQKLYVILHDGTSLIFDDHSFSPAINTWYFLRLTFNGSLYSYDISTDNETWTTIKSVSSQAKVANVTAYYQSIGVSRRYSNTRPFQGEIDLNNTYIKIDGQAWFGVCPVEVKHINLNSNAVNFLIKDGKLVFADSDVYISLDNNYTVGNAPTIVDGVVTNFNGNGYLNFDNFPFHSATTFEIIINATTTYTSSQPLQRLLSRGGSFYIRTISNNQWKIFVSTTDYSLGVNVSDYPFIKLVKKSGDLLDAYISTDGKSYTIAQTDIDVSGISDGNITLGSSAYEWLGTLNLNNTSMKVDGSLFFGKYYASQNIAPVPSGFTYGTTTTTDVGLVNMVTQVFTAVPGATWGKDN